MNRAWNIYNPGFYKAQADGIYFESSQKGRK